MGSNSMVIGCCDAREWHVWDSIRICGWYSQSPNFCHENRVTDEKKPPCNWNTCINTSQIEVILNHLILLSQTHTIKTKCIRYAKSHLGGRMDSWFQSNLYQCATKCEEIVCWTDLIEDRHPEKSLQLIEVIQKKPWKKIQCKWSIHVYRDIHIWSIYILSYTKHWCNLPQNHSNDRDWKKWAFQDPSHMCLM